MNRDLFFSSNFDSWTTPKELFNILNEKYKFNLDLCASKENALCKRYYSEQDSCFNHELNASDIVFCNPPYSRQLYKFIKYIYMQSLNGAKIVLLIPSRTDTKYFHEFIYNKARIEFIKGRLKFGDGKSSAPFPSMLVYFNC